MGGECLFLTLPPVPAWAVSKMARKSGLFEGNAMGKVSVPDVGTKTKGTSRSLLRTLVGYPVRHVAKEMSWQLHLASSNRESKRQALKKKESLFFLQTPLILELGNPGLVWFCSVTRTPGSFFFSALPLFWRIASWSESGSWKSGLRLSGRKKEEGENSNGSPLRY